MNILGIETSCGETSIAVVASGREVLAQTTHTQILDHTAFGGVIPELASRKHVEYILPVLQDTLDKAGKTLESIDAIAVTTGPGLLGSLLVGVNVAKTLSYLYHKPCIGVDHLHAHLYAPWLYRPDSEPAAIQFPVLSLTVSGGHTSLVLQENHAKQMLLGQTRDDAAGEAFDKVSTLLHLGYPGGPAIQNVAQTGNPTAITFPRAMAHQPTLDFSFSGLKSAVLRVVQENTTLAVADIAASFQEAVVDSLLNKLQQAFHHYCPKTMVITGGVSANARLREKAKQQFSSVIFPDMAYCTDNAAMVAGAGYFLYGIADDTTKFRYDHITTSLESALG